MNVKQSKLTYQKLPWPKKSAWKYGVIYEALRGKSNRRWNIFEFDTPEEAAKAAHAVQQYGYKQDWIVQTSQDPRDRSKLAVRRTV